MADKVVLKLKQGESLSISMVINSNGSPLDLTNRTITVQVKASPNVDLEPIFEKEITTTSDIETVGQITAPTSGSFQVKFTEEDTSIPQNEYALIMFLNTGNEKDIISANCCCSGVYMVCPQ